MIPSAISYEPKIDSTAVQGRSTRARVQQKGETAEGGAVVFRWVQGVNEMDGMEMERLIWRGGQNR